MNKYYSLIILCFYLISCSDKTEVKYELLVDLENISQPSIYDFFSDINLIPLETTAESLIKEITKVKYHKDKYYVLDCPLHRILVFDNVGKYLHKIDNRGEGPSEYTDKIGRAHV